MLTSAQIRAARALLRWEQKDLMKASKVSLPTIKRLEVKAGPLGAHEVTVDAIIRAFDTAGVEFIAAESGKGAGVRFKIDQQAPEDS